jgi:hypothetical protein
MRVSVRYAAGDVTDVRNVVTPSAAASRLMRRF